MEDQDGWKSEDQKSAKDEKKIDEIVKVHNSKTAQNDAGTSGQNNLPGAVETPIAREHKYSISHSEHNLRHVFTTKDVANALKLCSLNFQPVSASIRNLDLIKLKMPDNRKNTEVFDVKKYLASIKLENEAPPKLRETPATHQQAKVTMERVEEHPTTTPNTMPLVHAQTEAPGVLEASKLNETLESKGSKASKKKPPSSAATRLEPVSLQRDSLSSIDSNVCRICMTKGRERLISPCYCKGSLANVHLSCLERWLNQVGRNHCELCGYSYPAIRTPRYTVLQALRLWFGNPRNRSHLQVGRHFMELIMPGHHFHGPSSDTLLESDLPLAVDVPKSTQTESERVSRESDPTPPNSDDTESPILSNWMLLGCICYIFLVGWCIKANNREHKL